VSARADVNARFQENSGWTPLHYAVAQLNGDVAKFLIENGAHADAVNAVGPII
jgi:ankyrin repeat protein